MVLTWLDDQKKKAELEAHRERARQCMAQMNNIKTSTWIQALMYIEAASSLEELRAATKSFGIYWTEEGPMTTTVKAVADLKSQIAELTKKLEKLEHGRWGKEPANGSVFKIERRYQEGGKGYACSAIRADGKWYLTGVGVDGTKTYTWESLQRWAGQYSRVWRMTAAEELVD